MINIESDKINGKTLFFKALFIVFLIRLFLSTWIPLTSDEAYFVLWGKNLDYGFYDHPPFVGWLLGAFLYISDATWWLRLPSVLLPIILSYWIFRLLQPRQPKVAAWVALVYLVAPVNIINFLITTDTPLIFFSFISVMFFYRAVCETKSWQDFLLTGLFLGLAFSSKYFAVFLGITYGFYIVLFHRNRRGLLGLGLMLLMVVPFAVVNILWNYNHCWNNILFNLVNRTVVTYDFLPSLLKYSGMLVGLYSPFLIYFLFKNKNVLKEQSSNSFTHVYMWLATIPLVLFLFLTLKKQIGLHWVLSFYPFAFIAVAGVLDVKQWRWTFHFMWVFSLLFVIGLASVMLLPVKTFADKKEAVQNLTFGKYPHEVLLHLKPYEKDYTFSTISYGLSSIASYYSDKHFIVFNHGSYHARCDDRLTDFRTLDGKNILIFKRTARGLEGLRKYFSNSERKTFKVRDVTFELLLGKKFNYSLYHKEVLHYVNNTFYKIPGWLPVGQCEFKDKYGFNNK